MGQDELHGWYQQRVDFITMGSFIDQGMLERDRIHVSTEEENILDNRQVRRPAIGKGDDSPHVSKKVDWAGRQRVCNYMDRNQLENKKKAQG